MPASTVRVSLHPYILLNNSASSYTTSLESTSPLKQYFFSPHSSHASLHTSCWCQCRQTLLLASSGQCREVSHRGWKLSTVAVWRGREAVSGPGVLSRSRWVGRNSYKASLTSWNQSKTHRSLITHTWIRKHFQLISNTNLENFMK